MLSFQGQNMDSFKHEEKFQTAIELINFFTEPKNFTINDYFDTSDQLPSRFIYRGQKCSTFDLKFSAFRDPECFKSQSPQPPNQELNNYLGHQLKAEEYAVFRFMEYADSVGLATPLNYEVLNIHTEMLMQAFKDNSYDFKDPFPHKSMYSAFAFAQHHGIKTRFLDWSESPLIAAYFAAEEHVFSIPEMDKPEFFSIHALDLKLIKNCKNLSVIKAPRFNNNFLREQKGVFTLLKNANQFYKIHNRWPTIEDELKYNFKSNNHETPLIKMTLPSCEARSLLQILYKFGITRLTLKPSLINAESDFEYRKKLFPK
jgi:hypothetical protein